MTHGFVALSPALAATALLAALVLREPTLRGRLLGGIAVGVSLVGLFTLVAG